MREVNRQEVSRKKLQIAFRSAQKLGSQTTDGHKRDAHKVGDPRSCPTAQIAVAFFLFVNPETSQQDSNRRLVQTDNLFLRTGWHTVYTFPQEEN
ncbi:MAG: hypothetical protein CME21_10070, partial [Gemmatimonadetes bacterium]|nr:hypothetical protein [Gemmatimonadota bacterium]